MQNDTPQIMIFYDIQVMIRILDFPLTQTGLRILYRVRKVSLEFKQIR